MGERIEAESLGELQTKVSLIADHKPRSEGKDGSAGMGSTTLSYLNTNAVEQIRSVRQ